MVGEYIPRNALEELVEAPFGRQIRAAAAWKALFDLRAKVLRGHFRSISALDTASNEMVRGRSGKGLEEMDEKSALADTRASEHHHPPTEERPLPKEEPLDLAEHVDAREECSVSGSLVLEVIPA
jgi:hypothetical protein